MKQIAAVLMVSLITACASPYRDMSFFGGVRVTMLSPEIAIVEASGNAYTSHSRIRDYLLLKSAEETLARGFDQFFVIQANQSESAFTLHTPGSSTTSWSGTVIGNHVSGYATTTTTPAYSTNFIKPDGAVKIHMLTNEHVETVRQAGTASPEVWSAVYDAAFIMQSIGARYGLTE